MFMAKFDVSILSATLSSLGLLVWVFAQRKTGGGGEGGVAWCSLVEISSAVKCFLILSRVSGFNRILVIDTAPFFSKGLALALMLLVGVNKVSRPLVAGVFFFFFFVVTPRS